MRKIISSPRALVCLKAALLSAAAIASTACASSPPRTSAGSGAGEDAGPVLVSGAVPEYTKEALENRVEGNVAAKCLITATGEVTGCRIVRSLPLMDQAVLDAIATWRCKPALRRGEPVAVEHVFNLRLVLPRDSAESNAAAANTINFDGKTMTRPRLVVGKDPIYTEEALRNRVQGMFAARCVITAEGEVRNCLVLKSIPLMNDAILDALMQRRYTPALLDGQPVNVRYVFNVKLVLPHR
jgi:TonB family protein